MREQTDNKSLYKSYCDANTRVSIFESYHWLSALLEPEEWSVLLSFEKNGEVNAAWPVFKKSKLGIRKITIPALTPYIGPTIKYPSDLGQSKKTSYEKQLLNELIEQLPNSDELVFHSNPLFSNWLPFFWKGYSQTTRYTYTLPIQSYDSAIKRFKASLRRELKKAQKSLNTRPSSNFSSLHQIKLQDYSTKNMSLPYNEEYFLRIKQFVEETKQGCLHEAVNAEGKVIASMLFLWDSTYLYYHTGAVIPEFRNSGAMTLLMNIGIQLASEKQLQFNFEGSMVEGIERYFSSFGAVQTPYFRIEKTNNKLLKLLNAIR